MQFSPDEARLARLTLVHDNSIGLEIGNLECHVILSTEGGRDLSRYDPTAVSS